MLTPTYIIRPLPPQTEIETVPVLKALVEANKALAELKGRAGDYRAYVGSGAVLE